MPEFFRFQTVKTEDVVEAVKGMREDPPRLVGTTAPCLLYRHEIKEGTFDPLCGSCEAARADHGEIELVVRRLMSLGGHQRGIMADSVSTYSPLPNTLTTTCDPDELGLQGLGTPNLVKVMEHHEGDVTLFSP